MNTTTIPDPIVNETRVSRLGGEEVHIKDARNGDAYNLTTGEASVARMIGGVRYDTTNASLIVGTGEYFGYGCYMLSRLYRTNDGKFFLLQMLWACDVGFVDIKAIDVIEHDCVLVIAKNVVAQDDIAKFLREWYCSGLLPLDDAFVQDWAETMLSADECQEVLAALGGRYAPHSDTQATADA